MFLNLFFCVNIPLKIARLLFFLSFIFHPPTPKHTKTVHLTFLSLYTQQSVPLCFLPFLFQHVSDLHLDHTFTEEAQCFNDTRVTQLTVGKVSLFILLTADDLHVDET